MERTHHSVILTKEFISKTALLKFKTTPWSEWVCIDLKVDVAYGKWWILNKTHAQNPPLKALEGTLTLV
jgi:hypothetical protein